MRRIVLFGVLCCIVACRALAIPAKYVPHFVQQKDGTMLTVYLRGDEHFHYYETEDYMPVVQGDDESYYYARLGCRSLLASDILAHNIQDRSTSETEYVKGSINSLTAYVSKMWSESRHASNKLIRTRASAGTNQNVFRGQRKGLVILVNFANMQMSNANEEFNMQFNQVGYNKNNHIGSVHDYFYDQSYGQFELTFDVVGPVTVSKDFSYYGKNDVMTGSDANPKEMVFEACSLADEFVDFKDYDWDGDGIVEQVFVIYAGYGESNGAPSNTIWPHQWALYNEELILDGARIYTYACSCELSGTTGTWMNGIGTACHEFSHCLGLPDFYNVNYTGGYGMDAWDLMNSGGHSGPNNSGEVPCGYSAYERWYLGWMDLTVLDGVTRIKEMPNLGESGIAYKICNDGTPDEYIILENRQSERWFSYVDTHTDCHGMLAYHVDYSASAWEQNSVNVNAKHQRMCVIPADNNYGQSYKNNYYPTATDLRGDLFPGLAGVTEFTNTSHVDFGGKWHNANLDGEYGINQPITNIKEENGLISFDFMGGIYVPTPQIYDASEVKAGGFTANWEALQGIDYYTLEVKDNRDTPYANILCSENFKIFTTEEGTDDGITNLLIYIDSYTQTPGWSASKIYTSQYGVKVGDGNGGFIMTPPIMSKKGSVTLKCGMQAKADQEVIVALVNSDNDTLSVNEFFVTGEEESFVFTFDDVPPVALRLCLYAGGAFYVGSFNAYDGRYTKEELLSSTVVGGLLKPQPTITIDSLYANQYRVEGLTGKKYKYRVKAVFDNASSEWSEYKEVDLTIDSGIKGVVDETAPEHIRVYDLNGTRVTSPQKNRLYIVDYGKNGRKQIQIR